MLEKRMERLQAFGDSLPFAKVYYREDWQTLYFDLSGKMFGTMSPEVTEQAIITLKGLPEKNEELREIYQDIQSGYHMNKKHWNSITLVTEELTDAELEQMIRLSYELVWKKLPAKVRRELESV
ncbi:MmcQ/YjbR family DNA-binding protein [Enterococcus olivae]